ncbi:hypothetical protein ACWD4F_40870 [Streptomyces aureus]
MSDDRSFGVGLALEGAGWHPAAWSHTSTTNRADLFTADHWMRLARTAAPGGIDFVPLEDGLGLRTDGFGTAADDTGRRVRNRLDSGVLTALLLATSDIPEVVVSRT